MTKIPLSDDELDGVSGGAFRPDPRAEAYKMQQQYQAEMAAQARHAAEVQKAYMTAQAEGAKRYQAEQAQHQPESVKTRTVEQAQHQPSVKSTGAGGTTGPVSTASPAENFPSGLSNNPIAKGLYSSLTNSDEFKMASPEDQKKLSERFVSSANSVSSLDSSSFSGDVSKLLSKAMIEFAGQQRQQAMDDRQQVRGAAQAELLKQADELAKSADKARGDFVSNVISSSAISIAGFMGSSGAGANAIKSSMLDDHGKAAKGANTGADGLSKDSLSVDPLGKAKAIATADGTHSNFKASQSDQLAKAGSPTADGSDAMSEQIAATNSSVEAAKASMMKDITSFIRELQDAEVQAMRALTKG